MICVKSLRIKKNEKVSKSSFGFDSALDGGAISF